MANLSTSFVGIKSPNPFWLASAPPRAAARAGPRMLVTLGVCLTMTGMRVCCLHQRVTIST